MTERILIQQIHTEEDNCMRKAQQDIADIVKRHKQCKIAQNLKSQHQHKFRGRKRAAHFNVTVLILQQQKKCHQRIRDDNSRYSVFGQCQNICSHPILNRAFSVMAGGEAVPAEKLRDFPRSFPARIWGTVLIQYLFVRADHAAQ